MAYKDFKFKDLKDKFGIEQTTAPLFTQKTNLIAPSEDLLIALQRTKDMPLTTEKMISESLIFPILTEIRINNKASIELFSGEMLNANKQEGLIGELDFVFAKAPGSKELLAPIINITEAKRGDIENPRALSQTAAQLLGAQVFNKNDNQNIKAIYGVCTSGVTWVFMKLENKTITIDTERYTINDLPQLLGVFQYIIEQSN